MSSSFAANRRPRTIALAGLTIAGALLATSACSGSSSTPAGTPTGTPAGTGMHHHGKGGRKGIVGKITAENGSTWTVVNAKGKQFTVTITPQTAFGTKNAAATQQQFTVGENIRAMGQVANGAVTATRIAQAKGTAGAAASSSAPAPAGG